MGLTQLNFQNETKVETAIERLKLYEPPGGYFLAFSGGKDSICIYDLAIEAGVKFDAHYSVSPIDPPELHQFIREHYPDVQWDYTAKGFFRLVAKKGLPYRNRQWCCEIIKHLQGKGRTRILGLRWEESTKRKNSYHTFYEQSGKRPPSFRLMPILDWNEAEVWEYIEGNGLAFPNLYDEGFSRIGCVMCPLAGRPQMRREAQRWPKIAFAWWRATERYFILNHKPEYKKYQSAADMWRWWTGMEPPEHKGKPLGELNGSSYNTGFGIR